MKNQFNKISRLKIAMAVTLWPVAMLTVGSLQRDFFCRKGGYYVGQQRKDFKVSFRSLGRISGRLHLLAQVLVTTQAVKAIDSQKGVLKKKKFFTLTQNDMSICFSKKSTR